MRKTDIVVCLCTWNEKALPDFPWMHLLQFSSKTRVSQPRQSSCFLGTALNVWQVWGHQHYCADGCWCYHVGNSGILMSWRDRQRHLSSQREGRHYSREREGERERPEGLIWSLNHPKPDKKVSDWPKTHLHQHWPAPGGLTLATFIKTHSTSTACCII